MKVSLNWLKEYVDIDLPAAQLAEKLIHTGFNLESIEETAGDIVLDLEITSNRPDCLGHIGVAREAATILDKELKIPAVDFKATEKPVKDFADLEVLSPDLCPRYIARVITNVKVGPSPAWMVERLEAIGLRSINNVVDITNYVMLESGQPLHAFDLDKLIGKKIIVRKARLQEPFLAIDHSMHTLDPEVLVIADAERTVALAGVMGGLDSEVSDQTKNILLESAQFDPISIRRTARKLNLHSDSSYRFERKVDPVNVDWASRRAAALIAQLAGGQIAKGEIDVWKNPVIKPTEIKLRFKKINDVLGISVDMTKIINILFRLGFPKADFDGEHVVVTVPSYRAEVHREIDLIEEIGRIVGLDKIPTVGKINITPVPPSKTEKLIRIVHQSLNQSGYSEAITVTLVEPKYATLFTDLPADNALKVSGARRQANDTLRASLIPSLLMVRALNQDAGNQISDIYEIARVFNPLEQKKLAILSSSADLRSLRGALELILKSINSQEKIYLVSKPMPWFLPDQSAQILIGSKQIGIIGTIDQQTQKIFNLKKPAAVAEIDFSMIESLPLEDVKVAALPKIPGIERDISIIVDETVTWEKIKSVIINLNIEDLESIEFGELFRGKQVSAGQKSLFFTLRYRNPLRSLTHEQVDIYQQKVIEALSRECGAKLRTA